MPLEEQDYLPHLQDFNTVLESEDLLVEDVLLNLAETEEEPVPLGHDISWNFATGDFDLNSSLGLKITNQTNALHQWVINSLQTEKGSLIIYPKEFGSDLPRLIGSGLNITNISAEIIRAVNEAIIQHDRVDHIDNIAFRVLQGGETIEVGFTIVLDDNDELEFKLSAGTGD